jgi:hypothetical protein
MTKTMDQDDSMNEEISFNLNVDVQQVFNLGLLAETIKTHVKVLEDYHRKDGTSLISFDSIAHTSTLSSRMSPSVLQAKEQIIDSALRLLELTAGPSKTIAIACSQASSQYVGEAKLTCLTLMPGHRFR